jgi:hypothetical protein
MVSVATHNPDAMSIYTDIIAANPLTYFHQEEIPAFDSPNDPLTRVVPSLAIPFFGPFVCNFLVFTRLQGGFTDAGSKARLIATYADFSRYELHIYIDSEASGIVSASPTARASFASQLSSLAAELAPYGVTYHGQLGGEQLKASIEAMISAFDQACNNLL